MKEETVDLIKENIIIYGIIDGDICIEAHTKGATDLIGCELEIVTPLELTLMVYILNNVVGEIYDGKINIEFNKNISTNFTMYPIRFMECDFGEANKTIRIILPDECGNFPDTSTNDLCKNQSIINTTNRPILKYVNLNDEFIIDRRNGFKKELQSLCRKYDVTLYAGMFGIVFNFENDNTQIIYYNQNSETKEFIKQQ